MKTKIVSQSQTMKTKTKGWYVQIIESLDDGTEKLDRELGPYVDERQADKAPATWTCRRCGAVCCEHRCGNKDSARMASCTSCLVRK